MRSRVELVERVPLPANKCLQIERGSRLNTSRKSSPPGVKKTIGKYMTATIPPPITSVDSGDIHSPTYKRAMYAKAAATIADKSDLLTALKRSDGKIDVPRKHQITCGTTHSVIA